MNYLTSDQNGPKLAVVGALFMLPALTLAFGGVMQSVFGIRAVNNLLGQAGFFQLLHPLIVLGGIAVGFLLNVLPAVRVAAQVEDGAFIGSIKIRGLLNLALIALCLLVTGIIFLYLFVENFQFVPH